MSQTIMVQDVVGTGGKLNRHTPSTAVRLAQAVDVVRRMACDDEA